MFEKFLKWAFGPEKNKDLDIPRPEGYFAGSYESGYPMYMGAGPGGEKYPYGLQGHGVNVNWDHYTLRTRARRAMQDTPIARAIVGRYDDSCIDTGLILRPLPNAKILGISDEQAEEWAENVGNRFDQWAKSKDSIRDGSMNFYQFQSFCFASQWRDGEYFTRFYYSKDTNLQNPLQLQAIDPSQITPDTFTSGYGNNPTSNLGIIKNAAGKPIAYQILRSNALNGYKNEIVELPARIGNRILMIHGFQPENAGQDRGFSKLSHVLQEFANLTDFNLAHIKKAIIQSTFGFYTKPSPDASASNPLIDLSVAAGGAGPYQEELATSSVGKENNVGVNYQPITEAQMNFPGAMGVFSLKGGEDFKAIEQNTPMQTYDSFVNAFITSLAASVNMPMEILLMRFNSNYSASRAALLMFWRVCQKWRRELSTDLLDPVYKMWALGEIAAGRISAPGIQDPIIRAAWTNSTWIGSSPPNIDPARSAKADMIYAELGAKSLDQIALEVSNSSGRANRARLTREYADLPIPPWSKAAPTTEILEEDET